MADLCYRNLYTFHLIIKFFILHSSLFTFFTIFATKIRKITKTKIYDSFFQYTAKEYYCY